MQHPYYISAKAEQRQEAIEKNRMDAINYLIEVASRPVGGRVLEPVGETKH